MSGRVVEGVVLSVSLVFALHAVGSDSEHVFCASRELLWVPIVIPCGVRGRGRSIWVPGTWPPSSGLVCGLSTWSVQTSSELPVDSVSSTRMSVWVSGGVLWCPRVLILVSMCGVWKNEKIEIWHDHIPVGMCVCFELCVKNDVFTVCFEGCLSVVNERNRPAKLARVVGRKGCSLILGDCWNWWSCILGNVLCTPVFCFES